MFTSSDAVMRMPWPIMPTGNIASAGNVTASQLAASHSQLANLQLATCQLVGSPNHSWVPGHSQATAGQLATTSWQAKDSWPLAQAHDRNYCSQEVRRCELLLP